MRALYFLTPGHGNTGDSMQAYRIHKMLSIFFETVLEFNVRETDKGLEQVLSDDIIFLSSGGNLGDLWPAVETQRCNIIKACPNNMIVSFPQTIHFSSKERAKISSNIYKAHTNLHTFARDPMSYNTAKELFNSVQQLPDPVFTMLHNKKNKRKGILCIFRNDKEDFIKNTKKQIIAHCSSIDTVDIKDTHIKMPMTEEKLLGYLDMVSKYRLVVTDRFHGAIFAAITGTPCFAFPTINHKITEGHYWHKRFGTKNVLCKDISELKELTKDIPEPYIYNPSEAIGLYHQVISSVRATGKVPILNSTEKVMTSRRTVRKWKERTLPKCVLQDIVQAGVNAPSGSNAQCVKFKIIQNKSIISILSKKVLGNSVNIPSVVIMVGYDFGVKGTINYQHKSAIWEQLKYQDVAVAIQNMQLYCESIGLSCCWYSFFPTQRQRFLDEISIKNNNIEYLSGLAIGFAKGVTETKHRNLSIKRKNVEDYIL